MTSAPPARITAAGPLARTPRPRKAPNKIKLRAEALGWGDGISVDRKTPRLRRRFAAAAMARAIDALKSMSGVAARAKPMAATLVAKIIGARRTGCARPVAAARPSSGRDGS